MEGGMVRARAGEKASPSVLLVDCEWNFLEQRDRPVAVASEGQAHGDDDLTAAVEPRPAISHEEVAVDGQRAGGWRGTLRG